MNYKNGWYVYDPIAANNDKPLTQIIFDPTNNQYEFYSASGKYDIRKRTSKTEFTNQDIYNFYTYNYIHAEQGQGDTYLIYIPEIFEL
jgi:hypothetical protein